MTGRRLLWQAAKVTGVRRETSTARTLVLSVPGWPGHLPGQHVDVRLTAEDGYTAQRSYSIAAPADGDVVELTVQVVEDGEVSPYLAEVLEVGDEVELRGPVGGWFVWRSANPAPVLLVAGGSGIVPLMSMVRAIGTAVPYELVYSVREPEQVFYARELERLDVTYVYTRRAPDGWTRPPGRLAAADLSGPPRDCFVCGPTGFVEAAADLLISLGHEPSAIRTERFGPTGG